MNRLSNDTVRLISSTQVITSVSSAVKELVENSLDANATSVDVKLDNFGLDKIEIRDNGCGIKVCDIPFAGQRHYTSKIQTHEDLQLLSSYGFRGEALGSICELANVSVCTRTKDELHSTLYSLDSLGKIVGRKPSHSPVGTTVIVKGLFQNLPVRKQFFNNAKKKKEQLKLIEDNLMSVGLAHPPLHVHFSNNKMLVWQKPKASTLRSALISVLTSAVVKNLVEVKQEDGPLSVHMFLPKVPAPRKTSDRTFLIINSRPVRDKEIDKLLKTMCNTEDASGWPVCVVILRVPNETIDVNMNANKTQVMLSQKDEVLELVKHAVSKLHEDNQEILISSKTSASPAVQDFVDINANFDIGINVNDTTELALTDANEPKTDISGKSKKQDHTLADQSSLLHLITSSSKETDGSSQVCGSNQEKDTSPQPRVVENQTLRSLAEDTFPKVPETCSKTKSSNRLSDPDNCVELNENRNEAKASAALWSRGEMYKDRDVQPVKLLTNNIGDNRATKTPSRKRSLEESCTSYQTTLDGILTLTNKKPRSVFEIDEDFDRLSEVDQMKCISSASSEWDAYQKQQRNTTTVQSDKKSKNKARRSFLAVKHYEDEETPEVETHNNSDIVIEEQIVDAPFDSIKNNVYEVIRMQQDKKQTPATDFDFIGHLDRKGAIVCRNVSTLFIANLIRLCENVVFSSLLEKHVLQCTRLDSPILLDDKVVGSEGLEVLDNLKVSQVDGLCADAEVLDPRVMSNGFKVRKINEEDTGRTFYQLHAMTLSISYYKVQDLKDILLKIHKNNDISVTESRPSSVFYYLQGEAARIAWGNPLPDDTDEICDMVLRSINAKQGINELWEMKCFHSLPVFHKLANLKRYKKTGST